MQTQINPKLLAAVGAAADRYRDTVVRFAAQPHPDTNRAYGNAAHKLHQLVGQCLEVHFHKPEGKEDAPLS